jgi:hypothetical protein
MTIETKFDIGQKVTILDLDRALSVVQAICIGEKGTTYEVAWFNNGERKAAWVFAHELRKRD